MISTDRKIFEQGSAVRERIIEYGNLFDELHVIVFAKKNLRLKEEHSAPNVWMYPTNSRFRIFYPLGAYQKAVRIMKKQNQKRQTVVTAQDPFETGISALCISRRLKAKLQIQVHTDFLNPLFIHASLMNQVRLYVGVFVLARADGIRVVSHAIKASIIKHLAIPERRITVLPIFVDVAYIMAREPKIDLRLQYPHFKFIILMASRLTREKNIGFALEVLHQVLNTYPFTGLVIVGEGPLEGSLKKQAKSLGIDNSVVFEPWQKDIISYMKTANIFLSTSLYEGYGLTIIEAALSGCPIVCSPVGVIREMPRNAVSVCPKSDPACFTAALISLIEHNEKKAEQKLAAREHFQNHLPTKRKYLMLFKHAMELHTDDPLVHL